MKLQPLFVLIFDLVLFMGTTTSLAQAVEETPSVPTDKSGQTQSPIPQVLFKPSGKGQPPTTRGAGSRNDRLCSQDAVTNSGRSLAQPLALTALVPSNRSGLTWAERPTFWVYLPKTSAGQLVLSVRENGSRLHSQRLLPITEAGIVGLQLAADSPPLEVGKLYQWAVVQVCGNRPHPNDPVVTAWVQRVASSQSLNEQLSVLERAAQYAEQGVWYDALTVLVEAQRSQPNNPAVVKIWADFLAQPDVGLGAFANEPLR